MRLINKILPAILLVGMICVTTARAEEACKFFKESKANSATDKFNKSVKYAIEKFYKSLESAKKYSAGKADLDEVKLIEAALAGESVKDFTSSRSKSARKSLDSNIKRAADTYIRDMKSAIKTALGKGSTSSAEEIQNIITQLEEAKAHESLSTGEGKVLRFTVHANKDWQKTNIEVKKGSGVSIEASGKWSPGARKRTSKHKWEYIYGGPDTYHYQAKIPGAGEEKVKKGLGSEAAFVAPKDGILEFRPGSYKTGRKGDAKGTLYLKIKIKAPVNEKEGDLDLYLTCKQIIETTGGSAAASTATDSTSTDTTGNATDSNATAGASSKTIKLNANSPWKDTGVATKRGQVINFMISGKWTHGTNTKAKKKRANRLYEVNKIPVQVRIGSSTPVVVGKGDIHSIVSPSSGNIFVRKIPVRDDSGWKGTPTGTLKITITVK